MSNLLIIDKDRNLCTDVCNFFRSIGYTPQRAHDYQSALLLLEQQNFNLIISNVNIPGGNICDLVRPTVTWSWAAK